MASPASRNRGFTLIELLVVVTLSAIMLGLAVPAFKNFIASQRVKTAASEIVTTMLISRSEAVKRNQVITITPNASGNWGAGWVATQSATTLVAQDAFNDLTISGPATVTYLANGRVGGTSWFTVTSAAVSTTKRCVKVDLTGIPSTSSGACS